MIFFLAYLLFAPAFILALGALVAARRQAAGTAAAALGLAALFAAAGIWLLV